MKTVIAAKKKQKAPLGKEAPLLVRLLIYWFKALAKNKVAFIGAIIVAVMLLLGIFAPYIAPYDPQDIVTSRRLTPPGSEHLFGTDGFGRDVFSRVLFGTRLSLLISVSVVILTSVLGIMMGLLSGYYHRLDNILMRFLDGLMAFPSIVLQIALMAALGPRLSNVVIALSVSFAPRMARIVRSSVLVERRKQYVEAARALGLTDLRIMLFHLLPNSLAPVLIQATMVFAYAVLSEAALSFLGVGMSPEFPSWGNILSEGRNHIRRASWITFYPGVTIMIFVLAINLLGDGLRDILDPKLKQTN